jgi:hypothetical protein
MEPGDYNEILLCKILYFVRGTELLAEKKMTQNRSENGGSAWIALCAQPTHTDT